MILDKIRLTEQEELIQNGNIITLKVGKIYKISTEIIGLSGKPFSAYFGIISLDTNEKEVDRKIRWINDFSSITKTISITFKASTKNSVFIYRINHETPIKCACSYLLTPIDQFKIIEMDDSVKEEYDDIRNYSIGRSAELSKSQEEILENNLVWIFGYPRSGTSWLAGLLNHKNQSINELHISEHLGAVANHKEKIIRRFDLLKNTPNYFFSNNYKNIWEFYLRKMILNRIFCQIGEYSYNVIIKEPSQTDGSDIISKCLPKSKIIVIIRDGRDVIDSVIDAMRPNGFMTIQEGYPPITNENRLEWVKEIANQWVAVTENLLHTHDAHDKGLRYIVKYENLLENTRGELKKIYQFLKIDIDDRDLFNIIHKNDFSEIPKDMKGPGKFFRSAKPGSWKNNLNKTEQEIVGGIMVKTLKKLGYN